MENLENQTKETQINSDDNHPIEKIPDVVLLKMARKEIGELTSYIDELEYKVTELGRKIKEKEQLTHEDNKEFKREQFYKEMNEKVHERNIIIRDLKKENERLLYNNLKNCRECISKKSNNSQKIKVLDVDTNSIHDAVMVDYDDNIVIMESQEYGRTRNSIDKVKFFI